MPAPVSFAAVPKRIFKCFSILTIIASSATFAETPAQSEVFEAPGGVRVLVTASFASRPEGAVSCVAITNLSSAPTEFPDLPKKVIGFGFNADPDLDVSARISLVGSPFIDRFSPVTVLPGGDRILSDVLFAVPGFSESLDNGLQIDQTAFTCMVLSSERELTSDEMLDRFFVVVDDGSQTCGEFESVILSPDPGTSLMSISFVRPDEVCYSKMNFSIESSSIVTGFGFALPWDRTSYSLASIEPSPQPGDQRFFFSNSPGRLRLTDTFGSGKLSFALLTGGLFERGLTQFGIPATGLLANKTSSAFCIKGNYSGLDALEILNRAVVRLPESNRTVTRLCRITVPGGGGLRGTVATRPL